MKRSNLFILFIGVAIIFFGCTKDDAVAPDRSQNDQETKSLKFPGTSYTGTSEPVPGGIFELGEWTYLPNGKVKIKGLIAEWYETANTHLLTGTSMWYENVSYNEYDPEVKLWGSVEIEVEGGEGVWKGTWHGYGTHSGDMPYVFFVSPLIVDIELVLTGHGGEIQGMVAKSTWHLDSSLEIKYYYEGTYH